CCSAVFVSIVIHSTYVFRFSFFFYCYRALRDLHSFPTRRSSDLSALGAAAAAPWRHQYEDGRDRPVREGRERAGHDRRHQPPPRSEEHTSELQSPCNLVCRLLLEKKKKKNYNKAIYKHKQ